MFFPSSSETWIETSSVHLSSPFLLLLLQLVPTPYLLLLLPYERKLLVPSAFYLFVLLEPTPTLPNFPSKRATCLPVFLQLSSSSTTLDREAFQPFNLQKTTPSRTQTSSVPVECEAGRDLHGFVRTGRTSLEAGAVEIGG